MYKVYATVFSREFGTQVKKCMGVFDNYMNANLFANAYSAHYCAKTTIVEEKEEVL